MSGGRLVVLDRLGRDVKRFPLPSGLATLGSDPRCDIRVMLPSVAPHHATVVVHANQTVVRNVGCGETLVNGRAVSVAALCHGDVLAVGGRALRWEYAQPAAPRPLQPQPAIYTRPRATRKRRLNSDAAPPAARSPALQLALELQQRASMPGSAGGKQVAIVQPQRRATTEQNEASSPRSGGAPKRPRSHAAAAAAAATKAELWIESRKNTPRSAQKAPPLRLTVLRRAASFTKVQPPAVIDHTKQAAIMLMTGHTPKSKLSSPHLARRTPSFLVKKPSPVRKTPRGRKSSRKSSPKSAKSTPKSGKSSSNSRKSTPRNETEDVTPTRGSFGSRKSSRGSGSQSLTILEISDSDARKTSPRANSSSRRSLTSPQQSPLLPSPKKSALKDPRKSKSSRKTESIKFDLSNLENYSQNQEDVSKSSRHSEDLALRYSDISSVRSPSPRKSIHSRSSRILDKSLGTTLGESPARTTRSTLTPQAPDSARSRRSRGSMIVQKALQHNESARYSRRTTKTLTDQSCDNTVASAFRTRTLSPRSPEQNLETYSIVDLVSMDSNESGRSVYNSADSASSSTVAFGTPRNSAGRKTRSTIDPVLVESSTPYVAKTTRKSSTRSRSSPNISRNSSFKENVSRAESSTSSRRSKSLTTPDNTLKHISVNSTRVSRGSRSRSRVGESDLLLISDNSYASEGSPPAATSTRASRTSSLDAKRNSSTRSSPIVPRKSTRKSGGDVTPNGTPHGRTSTPENRHSPQQVGTPVLSIQSLLDSSQSSLASQNSARKGRVAANLKRKTIGAIRTGPKNRRSGFKSKSLNFTARRGLLRLSKDSSTSDKANESTEKMVTPKSAVKLVQEAVKNKHSTAKKPQSKRSIIDDLDESDIVKQLFNSPVKRKLSQSMTEFSRKQLFDDEETTSAKRPTRNTIALAGRTPDRSALDHTEVYTPERFVSPIGTPSNSPDVAGIKRLFRKNTPDNDLSNVRGVGGLRRSRARSDLTDVAGVKRIFAKSPKNRLSDVRVKEIFAEGPKNDLRRVSGVKSLFRAQKERQSPTNGLTDVRGVKKLFQRKSPVNDLRRVSGVKRALQKGSPRNDLRDVRGVRRMFREERKKKDLSDVSGVEELFNESTASRDPDTLFDRLLGKPPIKAKYSKSLLKIPPRKPNTRLVRSLRESIDMITDNVEEWLEQELQKRLHRDTGDKSDKVKNTSTNRELQKLVTDTVEGEAPIRTSRARAGAPNVSQRKSASELYGAHTLPIKKRSLINKSGKESSEVGVDAGRASRGSANSSLPLKKRVLHSTPLKGRRPAAPALARVSPIPAAGDGYDGSDKPSKEPTILPETQPRARRTTKARTEAEAATPKPSPEPRAGALPPTEPETGPAPAMSPKPARARRTKVDQEEPKQTAQVIPKNTRTRKRPEVAKESPKASPKIARAGRSRQTVVEKSPSPKKVKPATPKRITRAKALKATVVVSKPSPQLKPRRGKAETEAPKRNTRKTVAAESDSGGARDNKRRKIESPKQSIPKTRKTNEPKTKKTEPEPAPETRRGRATRAVEVQQPKKQQPKKQQPKKQQQTDGTSAANAPAGAQAEPAANSTPVPELTTRKRKTTAEEVVPAKVSKVAETKTTRGKKKAETKTTRGKEAETKIAQDKKESETKITRGKKEAETKTTRGKKEAEAKTTKGKKEAETKTAQGKKGSETEITLAKKEAETKTTRGKKVVEAQDSEVPQKRAGRSKKAEVTVIDQPKTTRTRKTAAALEPVQVKTTRKRNPTVLPVKEAANKNAGSRNTRTRTAKQEHIEVPAKPAGRSRRR